MRYLYSKRDILISRDISKIFPARFAFVKMFAAGCKPVTGLTSRSLQCTHAQRTGVTKIIYARAIRNITKKNQCRVINRGLFLSAATMFASEFALSAFFTRVSAGASSHYGDPRDVTAKYFSARAERMPNAYPNHKCVDTHCRPAIGHATAYNRRF